MHRCYCFTLYLGVTLLRDKAVDEGRMDGRMMDGWTQAVHDRNYHKLNAD